MTTHRFSVPDLSRRLLAPIAALLGLVAGLSVLILPVTLLAVPGGPGLGQLLWA